MTAAQLRKYELALAAARRARDPDGIYAVVEACAPHSHLPDVRALREQAERAYVRARSGA